MSGFASRAALSLAVFAAGACAPDRPTVTPLACRLADSTVVAKCATFDVWENRETKRGRRIALNIVVIPARVPTGARRAVFYLDGGPGAAATSAIPGILRVLAPIREKSDVVFIDVRGTGRSHPLHCSAPAETAPLQEYFQEMFPDSIVRQCLARQDADVTQYTTPIAIDDLDEVRAALGYDRIDLYGISGGTRAAQIYMKRHPGSLRAVVLQGVTPMDGEMPLASPKALEAGMRALLDACAAEVECHRAFPDLSGDWERAKRRFDNGPVEASLTHAITGRSGKVTITRGVFADGIRHILYDLNRARTLPDLIRSASRGVFEPFAQREFQTRLMYDRMLAYGVLLTTTCAEDLRFITEDDIHRATDSTFLGDYRVRRQLAACVLWPRGAGVDDDYQQPVRASIPTLVISGDVDVATPAADGERVARELPKARHVIFANQSHNPANVSCLSGIIAQFLETTRTAELDVRCAAETRRPPFETAPGSGWR